MMDTGINRDVKTILGKRRFRPFRILHIIRRIRYSSL